MPIDPVLLARFRSQPKRLPPRTMAARREQAAAADAKAWAEFGIAELPEVDIEEVIVPVSGNFPDVRIRLHRPPGSTSPLPGYVFFFGGAFRQGGIDYWFNQWSNRARAVEGGVITIAVDYALAPEHRAPTQIEQGLAVLDWIAAHGADHGIDPATVVIGGQSSGGNLAACVANQNHDRGGPPIALQLLEVPALDLTMRSATYDVLAEVGIPRFLATLDRRSISRAYFGSKRAEADPKYSPLRRRDLTGLPPAVLMAAEKDILRGDTIAYHTRLREAGVQSSAMIAVGQTHDSNGAIAALLAAQHWHGSVVGCLRQVGQIPGPI